MRKAVETGKVMDAISLEWRGSFREDGSYTLGEKEYRMSDARDNTRFIMNGRKLLKEQIMKNRENNGSLLALPGMPQYRRTRRVEGNYLLTEADADKHFEDSIGCTGHWLKPGIVYEIPYRTILCKNLANVLASGRNVSASGDAWEALRVIPPAAVTGEAAGTAAALAIKEKRAVTEVAASDVQESLERAGVILHF
jgi:FAD dependent oxidoreductase